MIPSIIKDIKDGSETLVFGLCSLDLENLKEGMTLMIKRGGTVPYDVVIFAGGETDADVATAIDNAGVKMGFTREHTH